MEVQGIHEAIKLPENNANIDLSIAVNSDFDISYQQVECC
jgi:hypothetical protein